MGSSSDSDSSSGSDRGSGRERGFKFKTKTDKNERKEKREKDKKERKERRERERQERKEKKDKKHHDQDGYHHHGGPSILSHGPAYGAAAAPYLSSSSPPMFPTQGHGAPAPPPYAPSPGFPPVNIASKPSQFAPPPMSSNAPVSGFRIPLHTDSNFPPPDQTGPPVAYDADRVSPVFIGSALFEKSVHPCKIGSHLQPHASVPYAGAEHGHQGRYDLLPFVPEQMEWVHTSHGRVPPGRRPIEGGYEENGGKLYHALANVNGVAVPGKTGEHLGGANVAFGGEEKVYQEYQILCWK